MRPASVALLVLAAALAAACEPAPPPGRPLVITTFYPLHEFARAVAGDRMDVVTLVPPGVEPHDWEPAPQDVARVQAARVVVFNGAGLEPWIEGLVRDLPGAVAVDTTAGLALERRPAPARAGEAAEAGADGGAGIDPHVWLDPVLARAQVEAIRAGLATADPAGADTYAANARAYSARLDALHRAFEAGLRDCARREIVVAHAAFGYLARRYGLRQVALMGLAPEAEPSPADLARIVRFARSRDVQYIFVEPLVSPRLAETLGQEIGARMLALDPVEGLTPDDTAAGKSYITVMERNLQNLRTALACR
jgi:zinc transport system substrate-binding protein